MATHDDRQWILSLVQNAYVTTDDTGICELILEGGENGKKKVSEYPYLYQENEMPQIEPGENRQSSPDVSAYESSIKFPGYRHRPNAQDNNEKFKKERKAATMAKKVRWKYNPNVSEEDLAEMFQRKAVVTRSSETSEGEPPPRKSLLTYLLEDHEENNPFVAYSRFDGKIHSNVQTQDLKIYVYNSSHQLWQDYPILLSVVRDARVLDLIGLIAWKYTKENNQPPLKNVDHYELYMAEEDGAVEFEFKALERRDLVDKFEFPILALVERERPHDVKVHVTVYFSKAFSVIEVEHQEITLKEILERSISRRKEITKSRADGFEYHLEKEDKPGQVLDMNKTLSEVNCTEFAAVRDHSKRTHRYSISYQTSAANQTFFVSWERRMAKFETKIDISGEMVEFHPLQIKGSSNLLLGRTPHPLRTPTSLLVDCQIRELEKKERTEIVLTMKGENSFKDYRFVCEPCDGRRLYETCQQLLKTNLNTHRKPAFKRRNSLSIRKRSSTNSFHHEI